MKTLTSPLLVAALIALLLGARMPGTSAQVEPTLSNDPDILVTPPSGEHSGEPDALEATLEQMALLLQGVQLKRRTIQSLQQELETTELAASRAELEQELEQALQQLREQQKLLQQISTGAADLSLFEEAPRREFSWQKEIEEVLKPVIYELKKITEKPRQLEALQAEREALQTRLDAAGIALAELQRLSRLTQSADLQKYLREQQADWRQQIDTLDNALQLVDFQLREQDDSELGKSELIFNALKDFFTGRGLNLIFAILAFVLTFILVRYVGYRIADALGRDPDRERRLASRLLHVVFQVLTVLLALFMTMATLYALGDWFLLTLLVIILVGMAFALRTSIPRYAEEVRFLLNLGSAREGERVIYEGVPYKISRLNLRSDLINPLLRGGHRQLPISIMLGLVSRRWAESEPWFPSRIGDHVVLSDDTFGEVTLQSPEVVELRIPGGNRKQYTIADYLALSPNNLSDQFGVYLNFGLDYALQADITAKVPDTLQTHLQQALKQREWGEHLRRCAVEFKQAGASALDLHIMCDFDGAAAAHYLAIQRCVQRLIVEVCNQQGWSIPFNQLTVHLPESQPAQPDSDAQP